ncbi:hypothetical protein N7519_009197 [Penicillium mononematosum]|uniref:uncharacterized protein n=1 Tax=Penicillium mononematosum TaxID=268346 RepID=UPI00254842F7|nr:uncharacterized protein N7519_009197 [Penicillium mononematosum]KAJ6178736.1 hypothetical protein N7519_009197 [Penicillium mononematosum]
MKQRGQGKTMGENWTPAPSPRGCKMGDEEMSTVYAAELRGAEMALQQIQEGWYRTVGKTNGRGRRRGKGRKRGNRKTWSNYQEGRHYSNGKVREKSSSSAMIQTRTSMIVF